MFVALSWDQTINWTKTFQVSPVVPNKTTAAKASWNVIATEYQIRSGDQLLSWRIATLSGRTITISPVSQNSGQYCYSTDGKTLICDKDLSWSIQQIFEWDTWWKLRFKKIIIENFTWTLMTGTNNMLCVKSGDILNCNTDPSSLWDPINIEWEDGQRCTYVCTLKDGDWKTCLEWKIECHQPAPSCEWECTGWSGITISWNTNRYCYKVNDTTIKCDLNSWTLATLQDLEGLSWNVYSQWTHFEFWNPNWNYSSNPWPTTQWNTSYSNFQPSNE